MSRSHQLTDFSLVDEHTSEDAKKHAREILQAAGYSEKDATNAQHDSRVLAGYKAALHSKFVPY